MAIIEIIKAIRIIWQDSTKSSAMLSTTTEGPILILAGAGSGKTRVITHRIAYLIESCSVRPEQVLAVTFTNKAAGEMKERVQRLLAGYYSQEARTGSPFISTFHSLCVRMLRRDIEKLELGFTRSFTIYDQDDQERLMKTVLRDIGADEKQAKATRSLISTAKNRGEEPYDDVTIRAFELYQRRLTTSNALDFDDLLIYAVRLLRKSKEAREWYHNRFRHVMVDEFQDTNGLQYSLVRLIVEGDGLAEKHDERNGGRAEVSALSVTNRNRSTGGAVLTSRSSSASARSFPRSR